MPYHKMPPIAMAFMHANTSGRRGHAETAVSRRAAQMRDTAAVKDTFIKTSHFATQNTYSR